MRCRLRALCYRSDAKLRGTLLVKYTLTHAYAAETLYRLQFSFSSGLRAMVAKAEALQMVQPNH